MSKPICGARVHHNGFEFPCWDEAEHLIEGVYYCDHHKSLSNGDKGRTLLEDIEEQEQLESLEAYSDKWWAYKSYRNSRGQA